MVSTAATSSSGQAAARSKSSDQNQVVAHPSTSLISQKPVMMFEILNKIQGVLNSESAVPQFIYFAKKMEEMRKKWLQSELRCKEYESRWHQANMERNTLYNQITELK